MKKIILLMLLTAPLFLFANNNLEQSGGSIKVVVTGFGSDEGTAKSGVYFNNEGERLTQQLSAKYNLTAEIQQRKAVFELKGLQSGKYAVSVMHDSNNNSKMDFNRMKIPIERYGFSRNPVVLVRPPLFDECAVQISDGKQIIVNITLK